MKFAGRHSISYLRKQIQNVTLWIYAIQELLPVDEILTWILRTIMQLSYNYTKFQTQTRHLSLLVDNGGIRL